MSDFNFTDPKLTSIINISDIVIFSVFDCNFICFVKFLLECISGTWLIPSLSLFLLLKDLFSNLQFECAKMSET